MKSVENVTPRIYISVRFIDKVEGNVVRLNSVFEFFDRDIMHMTVYFKTLITEQ